MILIFDLDGVITGERVYWDSAALALARFFGDKVTRPSLPMSLIAQVKSLAINSNWDLAYLLACCDVISSSSGRVSTAMRRVNGRGEREWLRSDVDDEDRCGSVAAMKETLRTFASWRGVDLLEQVGVEAAQAASSPDRTWLYKGHGYDSIHALCQSVHDGRLAQEDTFTIEQPAVDLQSMREILSGLRSRGTIMGIATGRSRPETMAPLRHFGVLDFFDAERIVCYDEIVATERHLFEQGTAASLTKPHPYSILRAAHPEASVRELFANRLRTIQDLCYVGDTVSDVLAAKAAGAFSIGVLTGVPDVDGLREGRRGELLLAGCDLITGSVLELPEALSSISRKR